MRHYLVIGLLFSCALAVSAPPAQGSPDRHVDVGSPPLLLVYDGSSADVQPNQPTVFAIDERAHYVGSVSVDQSAVADTTTTRQPEGPSIHAHKPAQDDHPLRARNSVVNRLPTLPKRLPALHLSQAWSVPHREGQLHRITHY